MITNISTYNTKIKTLSEILSMIKSDDFIISALGASEPKVILSNIHKIKENGVKNCTLTNCLPLNNYEFISNPYYKDTIFTNSWFYSPVLRKYHKNKNISFLPQHGHLFSKDTIYSAGKRRTVMLCSFSPMDKHGYMSMSLSSFYEKEFIDSGAIVIGEVNPNLPRTFGDTIVHISQIDALLEVDYPIITLPDEELSDADINIGKNIAELIDDGSTIQLGIGKIPNSVANELKHKRHLGVHSEMFTDSMCELVKSGVIDNSMKKIHRGKSICSFALGSKKLYEFLDDNPSVVFKSASYSNSPYVMGENPKMVSINTTLEVDLSGQCASESIGHIQYSGTGGQVDTCLGARLSEGGKSIIALYSVGKRINKEGKKKIFSKIVPMLKPGSTVTLSRNDIDYVVTENGIAKLKGLSIRERVNELINIAHPEFRDYLKYECEKYMLW